MPNTSISSQVDQALDIHCRLLPELTFYLVVLLLNCFTQASHLKVSELIYPRTGFDLSLLQNLDRPRPSNTVDIGQRDPDRLVSR